MLGRNSGATPGRRIVLRNQDALRSVGGLVGRKSGGGSGGLAKTAGDLKARLQIGALDPQAQLSYKLFEHEAEREAEEFKFRFDIYPVSQMRGVHAQIPTFLINIHKIDNVKDAEAYIARLNGVPKLFDQLIVNLKGARRERRDRAAVCFSARARRLPQGHQGEAIRFTGLTTARCSTISPRRWAP